MASKASSRPSRRVLITWAVALCALAGGLRLHRALTAPLFTSDGAYYYAVAERLHAGRGFSIPYVWNYFGGIPESLPIASNRYWMPMTSVLEAGAFALAGTSPLALRQAQDRPERRRGAGQPALSLAGQMPSVVLGALLAAFTFALAYALFGRLEAAVMAGLFWAISPQLVSIAASTDCFMAAAAFTSAALYAIWKARQGRLVWAALAGAAAGLAYLTRSDALVLAVVMGLLLVRPLMRRDRGAWSQAGAFAGAFVLIALPWWLRNWAAFGHPLGSSAVRTAWLVTYNDIFRTDAARLTAERYFASSQIVAAGFKAFVLYKELRLLAVIGGLTTALAVYGIIADSDRRRFAPWLWYTALAIGLSALVFPYPAIKGGFWHIVAGLCPFVFAAGAAGLMRLWDRARGRGWQRAAVWAAAGVTVAYFVALYPVVLRSAAGERDPFAALAADLARTAPGTAPVLTDNCWRLYHGTHRECAQFPTDGAGAALRVADALGAQYAVVQATSLDGIAPIQQALTTARFTRTAVLGEPGEQVYVYRIMDAAAADAQAKALNQRAIAAAQRGDFETALSAWHEAESLKPDFAPILANLALAYWRLDRPQEAYLCARRALRADPSNATAKQVLQAAQARG